MDPAHLRLFLLVAFLGTLAWALREASGRLAPKMALAPLAFLLTRRAILVTWVLGAVGMYVLLTQSVAANGKPPPPLAMTLGLSLLCGLGAAALVVAPTWALVRAFAPKPTVDLEDGETVRDRMKANHMLGNEARGGELLVTDRRLVFCPHRFNVQLDVWSLSFDAIRGATAEGTRLVLVQTEAGEEILVAPDNERLAATIRERAGAARRA